VSADPLTQAEVRGLEMAYRNRREFAIGHGVSVHAEVAAGDPTRAVAVKTRVVPVHDVARVEAPDVAEIPELAGLELDMRLLYETDDALALGEKLKPITNAYDAWIETQRARAEAGADGLTPHRDAAAAALARCRHAKQRIEDGIARLQSDPLAFRAFRFANRAMWQQRVRSTFAEAVRRGEKPALEAIDVPANRRWRPFQLAFVLLGFPSLANLAHPDRTDAKEALADLLWFPTGGGKTEAYLGLAAFAMGIRRLQGIVEGRSGEHGVTVLMRYTLRLLTLQQFQRATALICACELIRREAVEAGDLSWGSEPFRIGLWVGSKATPNSTADADTALGEMRGLQHGSGKATPAQLTNCPWCGRRIEPGKHMEVRNGASEIGRTLVFCGDDYGTCPFSKAKSKDEGIPAIVVDEEIYRRLPTLLIATVDKFAQMPWNGTTKLLFGELDERCSRHGFRSPDLEDADTHRKAGALPAAETTPHLPLRPPDLIIQDELHLISGPLGTLTGLYETAVDELSTWTVAGKRVRPKVIASTATIRRAREQVHALFLRNVEIFPPSGLDVEDNFFSRERDTSKVAGRRYLGICAPGRRLKVALIRVYTAQMAAAQQLFDRGGDVDPWMTLVGYFNSLRELAGMRRLVEDDVRSRLRDMDTRGLARRSRPRVEELTSRRRAAEIPALLDRMELAFQRDAGKPEPGKKGRAFPIDVLLATNMISVGVDVKRLGAMVTSGQPKTTAEYIQATSRVGRVAPGLVITVYNWAKPRDLSHYETFEHYHATFYRHVESLSVTPFASRALDRGLSGVLVALVRLAQGGYPRNEDAQRIRRDDPVVEHAIEVLCRRAERVSGSHVVGDQVRAMLKRRLDVWSARAAEPMVAARLGFKSKKDGSTRGLLEPAGEGTWNEFTCLNSLRDVEPTAALILDEGADALSTAREIW
ncbi:MAG: DISARM system helicase DrmA, partial [Polyangiales bacterium]